ncbi:MAG: hypothetical protein J6U22_05600 [Bacteroidaceae bacterium]|nr:hypothetical protein [Bacteroidaceae bacterium]MBP5646405.1 hypothetical protein [Bacteroidaceae bacterium]
MTLFSACGNDKEKESDGQISLDTEESRNRFFLETDHQVHVVDSSTVNLLDLMKERIAALSDANSENDQALLELYKAQYERLDSTVNRMADSIAAANPGNSTLAIAGQLLTFGRATLNYADIGADGYPTIMSMLVLYPECVFDLEAQNTILDCHYTCTANQEVPTYNFEDISSEAALMAGEWASVVRRYFVVMPDYEGYGSSSRATHPYLNREVQARQCLSALIWARKWFVDEHDEDLEGNVVVQGFSQGGAVAAATYRYWLEHHGERWAQELFISGAVCGDGPYDPLSTLEYYCRSNRLTMPVAPALMLNGICKTDPEAIQAKLRVTDFVTDEFYESGIFKRIDSKKYVTTGCENAIREYATTHPGSFTFNQDGSLPTDQVLNKETYQYFLNGTEPADNYLLNKLKVLKHCLEKNALTYGFDLSRGFDLKMPLYGSIHMTPNYTFFHGHYDTVVPDINLDAVIGKWGSNAARVYRCTSDYDHSALGKIFFLQVHDDCVQDILERRWTPGSSEVTSILPDVLDFISKYF